VVTDPQDHFVETDKLNLCYRDEGDPSDPPVLMIMGLTSQLIHWPQGLVDKIVAEGYRVIRFDNRDSGLTSWLDDPPFGYYLAHMAEDAVKLLEHLGIEKAHVVGASLGGMIAQRLAIDHPERVQTLCSIMSTTHWSVGMPDDEVIDRLLEPLPADRDEAIAHIVALYELIGSKTYVEEERPYRQAMAAAAYDRGKDEHGKPRHPVAASMRQMGAIINAPNRAEALGGLSVPTLVIHGNEDTMINIVGGRATRDAMNPNAEWLAHPPDNGEDGVDGMGHDLPTPLHDAIVGAIVANINEPAVA
jgi:pimeloyl-ACP methyl ester carboxylesterase